MTKKPTLTLIKLGGSVITDKRNANSLRKRVLGRLITEINQARNELKDEFLIVGHGQGSFAHIPAAQYQTKQGFINGVSRFGMAVVQDRAAQTNRLVVAEFLKRQLPAISWSAGNSVITRNRQLNHGCTQVLSSYLQQDLLPVTYGDVLVDKKQGCTIWSTEEILGFLARQFKQQGWRVKQLIHVTDVAGVLGQEGQLIEQVGLANWPKVRQLVTKKTNGIDVTGGMKLKVEESLKLAQLGIKSLILSGNTVENLFLALTDQNWQGTEVA